MKTNSGSFIKPALLASLIVGSGFLAASAYAVTAGRVGSQPRCEAHQLQKSEAAREERRIAHLAELKEKLCRLASEGRSPEELAEEFGPSAESIRNWVAKANRKERPVTTSTSSLEEEVSRLRVVVEHMNRETQVLRQLTKLLLDESGLMQPASFLLVSLGHILTSPLAKPKRAEWQSGVVLPGASNRGKSSCE